MTPTLKFIGLAVSGLMLTGCVPDPKAYETPPVTVETAQGPVVCQHYLPDLVRWDRAISRPDSMSVAEADAICVNEGQKRKTEQAGSAPIVP